MTPAMGEVSETEGTSATPSMGSPRGSRMSAPGIAALRKMTKIVMADFTRTPLAIYR